MTIHCTTDAVEQRNKDEKEFPGEYGRGKTIDRIDYQSIIREGESEDQHTSMHAIVDIALQYSKLTRHIMQQEKDKEAIASMASADSHMENSILDVWSIIMNKKQLSREHFFLIVFQFADKTVNIIDNLALSEKPSTRYGDCDTLLEAFLRTLRAKYAARILLDQDNLLRDSTPYRAKLEERARQQQ
ncbi:hypothetical protein Cgig2_019232 [Carnegiea gigantea]|uniref:Uncharacterized protein n=1 Tax=Carnegiea gigantea TaxID=171969 RepID=A0A9Q1JWQ3_9CARY|nr:hypothetical protein Cgig2_019232 [Carnegiea gigantea]